MEIPFLKKKKTPEEIFEPEVITVTDIIAPPSVEIASNYLKIGEKFAKTYFIFSFPRYLSTAWSSPAINLAASMDISIHIHPIDTGPILKQLRKRVTEVQAEIMEREEKGLVREPALEIAYRDLEELRDKLQSARERMFRFGLYITVYGDDLKEISETENALRSIFDARLIYIKPATFQQKEGFISTAPYGLDLLAVHTAMNTQPLSSVFPFVSFDLSANEGILYGINLHNNSLVLFDRFSLENPNMTVFGTAGSGKSYAVKLEILRNLMVGVDIIIIDPENEYQFLSDAVGGSYFKVSLTAPYHINPLDLPVVREDERPEDVLRSNIINLVGLFRIMLGGLTPEEDALIDIALTETYRARDITPETDPSTWKDKIPLLSDFEEVLKGMEGTESLVKRLEKFTKGTYAGFFNQPTNISMKNRFVVFGVRDMEEELRPMAMYIIMRYVWNTIRAELKKRILVIDEAWWLMKTEDGASFLFGLVKRCRKYWLGVTTITQDVLDFLKSSYGQPIITNSALQLLMKTAPAAIDLVKKAFALTEEECAFLVGASVGEGLFFAGPAKHVIIGIRASYTEDQIITTSPEEILKIKRAKRELTEE
jgi:type IV secretory pathway VirB4 component